LSPGACVTVYLTVVAALFLSRCLRAEPGAAPSPFEQSAIQFFQLFYSAELARELELTTGQLSQIRHRIYEARRQMIDLKAKVDLAQLELEYIVASEEIDKKRAFDLADSVKNLERDVQELRISHTLAQTNIFTPKQRRKLRELAELTDLPPEWSEFLSLMRQRFSERRQESSDPPHTKGASN